MRAFSFADPDRAALAVRLRPLLLTCGLACAIIFAGGACDSAPTESSNTFAEVTNHKASLRIDPTTVASEIAFLDRGLEVQVIGRGIEKQRISGYNEFWYRIRLPDGIEGWIYGASLSIGSAGGKRRAPEQDAKELALSLVGKWWEVRTDGSTGYRRLYLWPDGVYKYAYGTEGPMREGKYTVQPEEMQLKLDPPSGMGDTVSLRRLGTELRMFAQTDGKKVSLRRAFLDPDAPDPLDPDDEKGEGESTGGEPAANSGSDGG
ncbi:MAG: SH3 domain-containing protein [bacterium]|nr:SH3 domain-containing protein [bacterium]